ncbi:hypothetical protein VNO80_08395 [Phaseolus coccineus]|uniref:Uncharacterized protein n=1 Tax=Phaseolus coccineus TaxID=3886 RepID=A0AAN9NLG8_PHACN
MQWYERSSTRVHKVSLSQRNIIIIVSLGHNNSESSCISQPLSNVVALSFPSFCRRSCSPCGSVGALGAGL